MNKSNFCSSFLMSPIIAIGMLSGCSKGSNIENTNPSTLSAAAKSTQLTATAANKPLSVCYVEVNNNSMLNVGRYTLQNSGKPLFDIGIIFAANINYDATQGKAVLYNNPQVTNVLSNASTTIKPLQQKGIKVLLSILGNHQGVGISNFTSRAAAHDFAQQLSSAVSTYGLDGIDFDDEYAEYGLHKGLPGSNDSSFVLLVEELRALMPNKLITFYYIGDATNSLSYGGKNAGSYVNYSWNAYYGTFSVPNVPGLGKANLGPAAIDITPNTGTSKTTAQSLAKQTVTGGYGVCLYYNLGSSNISSYLSTISNALYGTNTVYK